MPIDIRKNLERIALNFAHNLDQLDQFLAHDSTKGTKDEVQKFLDDRLVESVKFLSYLFKTQWHVLVRPPKEGGSFNVALSCEQLALLQVTGEVTGDTFLGILNGYYDWFLHQQSQKFDKEHERVADEEGKIIKKNQRKRSAPIVTPRKSKSRRDKKASRRRGRK